MNHKKHRSHPHDTMSAMPQFNEGHWERKIPEENVVKSRYSSEMNQAEEYKSSTDKLNNYVRSHKAEH